MKGILKYDRKNLEEVKICKKCIYFKRYVGLLRIPYVNGCSKFSTYNVLPQDIITGNYPENNVADEVGINYINMVPCKIMRKNKLSILDKIYLKIGSISIQQLCTLKGTLYEKKKYR